MRKIGFVFSHVHWDIEWYLPFRSFRFWLLRSLDRFVSTASRIPEFRSFVLDGQVAPIDHYLEVRPEKERAIRRLVRRGKLAVGPFYSQFDEWLTGPEAMVRNCRAGNRRARELGRVMKAGYLPDNFGHPAQMPQILQGFGLESLIFMRGMPDRPEEVGDQFRWVGLDDTSVLGVHLRHTYCNAHAVGSKPGAFGPPVFRAAPYGEYTQTPEFLHRAARETDLAKGSEALIAAARKAEAGCHSGVIPLANGFDSGVPQETIAAVIARANREQDEYRFVHGDCEELTRAIVARGGNLRSFAGELWGARYQYLLPGAISTRSYLKQANFACEALLERYAEPLASLAALDGAPWPERLLEEAWRHLFCNQAHDGIHGSSTDPAHEEMVQRFNAAKQIAVGIAHEALAVLAARRDRARDGELVLAYNPSDNRLEPGVIETWLHGYDPTRHVMHDEHGGELAVQVLDNPWAAEGPEGSGAASRGASSRAASRVPAWPDGNPSHVLLAATVPPGGVAALRLREGTPTRASMPGRQTATSIENEQLRVRFTAGALELYDKATGRTYAGLGLIEDEADRGDAWDFSEPWQRNPVLRSTDFPSTCRLIEAGPVRAALEITTRMRVPLRLDGERRSRDSVELPIVLKAALCRGARRLDLTVELDNRARDHRLRLVSPTGIRSRTILSQTHFGTLERPIRNPDEGKQGWSQPPPVTFPFREWLAASAGEHGLALAARGLFEYESRVGPKGVVLYVTLMRGFGRMGRANLKSRPGPASPAVPTPGAQCLGRQRFEVAFLPYTAGGESRAPFLSEALAFLYPPMAHQADPGHILVDRSITKRSSTDPVPTPPFRVEPANLRVSAFTRAADGDGWILRFWENEGRATEARVWIAPVFREVQEANLNEDPLRRLRATPEGLRLRAEPFRIVTLKLTAR